MTCVRLTPTGCKSIRMRLFAVPRPYLNIGCRLCSQNRSSRYGSAASLSVVLALCSSLGHPGGNDAHAMGDVGKVPLSARGR